MSDIKTIWDVASGRGDWSVTNGDLTSGNDVETAVLISLFTDRQAQPSDIVPDASIGNRDPRGWWAQDAKYQIGSRLWLLDRAKGVSDTPIRAKDYCIEALQWMLDDGVVARFDITTSWVQPSQLRIIIVAYRQDGSRISTISANLW